MGLANQLLGQKDTENRHADTWVEKSLVHCCIMNVWEVIIDLSHSARELELRS